MILEMGLRNHTLWGKCLTRTPEVRVHERHRIQKATVEIGNISLTR